MSAGATLPAAPAALAPLPRLAAGIAAVVLATAAFPFLPALGVALLCLILGAAIALPGAAAASVARGHDLGRFAPAGLMRRLLSGGGLRVLWHGTLGVLLAALLLVRLSAGGPGVWLATATAIPAVLLARAALAPLLTREFAPAHAAPVLRRTVQALAALAVLLASALIGLTLGPPDAAAAPPAASALAAQAFAAHRLWAGVELWLLGQAASLGLIPAWLAATLAAAATGATGWAAAALTLAALMPLDDARRAVGPASDAHQAPAPAPAALAAAALLAVAVLAAALWAEARLTAQPAEARPVAQLQQAAERIGATYHRPGTLAAIEAGRAQLRDRDAAARAELRAAVDAGFDAMIANVDPFLDGYYSLSAEYLRLLDLGAGYATGQGTARLESRLEAGLSETLYAGDPFAPIDATLAQLDLEAERARLLEAEAALLAASRLDPVNPGRLRLDSETEALPPLPELRSLGFATNLQTRIGASVLTGVMAGWIAHRVARRLVARGVFRVAGRALLAAVPGVGVVVALAADRAAIELEQYLNRDAFHAEIVAAIEAQRAELLDALD